MSEAQTETDIEKMIDSWLGEDTGSTPVSSQQDTTEGGVDGQQAASTQEGQVAGQQPATPDGKQAQPGNQQTKPSGNKEPDPQQAQAAKPGDLVGPDGRVLARAGAERRHYEAAQRATRDAHQARSEVERLTTELNAMRQANNLPQQLGLSVDDTATGLQLVASWKKNPVGVIQYLVEQAKAAGHTIEGIGGATDVGAIKTLLDQRLAPLQEQQNRAQQELQTRMEAERQVQTLLQEYGEAALVNGDALGKLIHASTDAGRPMNLEQAYLRFSNWCLQNGYDPSMPIDPQIAARRTNPPTAGNGQQSRNPPPPNGRAVSSPTGVTPIDPAAGITGNESTRDLVKQAMREAGFSIQ